MHTKTDVLTGVNPAEKIFTEKNMKYSALIGIETSLGWTLIENVISDIM